MLTRLKALLLSLVAVFLVLIVVEIEIFIAFVAWLTSAEKVFFAFSFAWVTRKPGQFALRIVRTWFVRRFVGAVRMGRIKRKLREPLHAVTSACTKKWREAPLTLRLFFVASVCGFVVGFGWLLYFATTAAAIAGLFWSATRKILLMALDYWFDWAIKPVRQFVDRHRRQHPKLRKFFKPIRSFLARLFSSLETAREQRESEKRKRETPPGL